MTGSWGTSGRLSFRPENSAANAAAIGRQSSAGGIGVRPRRGIPDGERAQVHRPPVGAGVKEFAGKEWILLLTSEYIAGKHRYADLNTIKLEPRVRAILLAK